MPEVVPEVVPPTDGLPVLAPNPHFSPAQEVERNAFAFRRMQSTSTTRCGITLLRNWATVVVLSV